MVHKVFLFIKKNIKLIKNIYNINVLINISMNLYDNSGIDCNKKNENIIYDFYNNVFLINSFIVINIKIVLSLLFINRSFYY